MDPGFSFNNQGHLVLDQETRLFNVIDNESNLLIRIVCKKQLYVVELLNLSCFIIIN